MVGECDDCHNLLMAPGWQRGRKKKHVNAPRPTSPAAAAAGTSSSTAGTRAAAPEALVQYSPHDVKCVFAWG